MTTSQLQRIGDLDSEGLAFWGVVSGTFTASEFVAMTASKGENTARSLVAHRLRHVLHDLANANVLSDATVNPPFDADRRCRSCGTVHSTNGFGGCLRGRWGDGAARATARSSKGGRRR